MTVHTAAVFDNARSAREAVVDLLDHHVSPRAMELVREPGSHRMPIRRPVRVVRDLVIGAAAGAMIGLVVSIGSAIFGPGLVIDWGMLDLLGVFTLTGALLGAFFALVSGRVRVELPERPLGPDERLVLGVEVNASRAAEVRAVIAKAGGQLADTPRA